MCSERTKVDVECLPRKGKGRNITCHWKYRVKYAYRATHFQTRPYFGVGVQHQDPVGLPSRKKERRYPVLQRDVCAPGSFWTGVAKRKRLTPKGILTPKCPFRSESLSRKQEPFYPVGYTHRPTKLGMVSRHQQGGESIICTEIFCICYFVYPVFYSKNYNFLQHLTCNTAHCAQFGKEHLCLLAVIVQFRHD